MSSAKLAKLAADVRDALVAVLWRQWAAVGGGAGATAALAQVDPEALILGSLALDHVERRFWVVMRDWLREGSGLLSVQRMGNLSGRFDETVRQRLGRVAWVAVHDAKDARWRGLAKRVEPPGPEESKRRTAGVSLDQPAALVLRLRSAFGVGVKADVLSFLLGRREEAARIALITRATGYTQPSVFRALRELVAARFVLASRSPPAEYWVRTPRWRSFLGLKGQVPPWRYWTEVTAYSLRFLEWVESRPAQHASDYALGVLWRRQVEGDESVFALTGILPKREPLPDSADAQEWTRLHERLAAWLRAKA